MKTKKINRKIVIAIISILSTLTIFSSYIIISQATIATAVTVASPVGAPDASDTTSSSTQDSTSSSEEQKDTTAPTIQYSDVTVDQGSSVNVLDNVTATDDQDGDLTDKITTIGTLDTSVVGDQVINLSVTDNSGNPAQVAKTFHVVAKAHIDETSESQLTTTSTSATASTSSSSVNSTSPMTLTIAGQTISYQNGGQTSGQSIIDADPTGTVSTWGSSATQSGDDGLNTHFIGHNPGAFAVLFNLVSGNQISVTDANGTATTYTVQTIMQVDDYGVNTSTGDDVWDLIVGTGGGERITLQSCINDDINLIVIAYK